MDGIGYKHHGYLFPAGSPMTQHPALRTQQLNCYKAMCEPAVPTPENRGVEMHGVMAVDRHWLETPSICMAWHVSLILELR